MLFRSTDWGWSDIACAWCDGGKWFTKLLFGYNVLWITVSIFKAQISQPTVHKAKIEGCSSVCSVK